MSIAIIFNHKEADSWVSKIQENYSENVEIYPNIKNKESIDFLLVWRPHENYLDEFPNVKVVHSIGAGVDHMLKTNLNSNVSFARIVDHDLKHDMFEHVLSIILVENKRLLTYLENQKQHLWKPKRYKSNKNTIVAILGVGEIGNYVAEQLVALGYQVKGWSKSPKKSLNYAYYFGDDGLNDVLNDSDFIVNILPLTKETTGFLNESFFNKLNSEPVLINVGRGKHVLEADLISALNNNLISKAYIDVFETEPLPSVHLYWNMEKVFITPHIASVTQAETCIEQIMINYKRMQSGKDILNVIDLKKGY